MTGTLLGDEPSTPAELAAVLTEAAALLDGVLDSITELQHATEQYRYELADAAEQVGRAWGAAAIARTVLTNLATRETLRRVTS